MSKGMRILVVEDEPHTSQAVQRFLEFRGHEVDVARSGSKAIELAAVRSPQVLVCDWKLEGGRDGVDVARQLQSHYRVPVILVTGHRLAQARKKARDSRVEVLAFRRKPVSLSDLAALIESVDPTP